MSGKVYRLVAALVFFVFVAKLPVFAQQSGSNPSIQGPGQQADVPPTSPGTTPPPADVATSNKLVLKVGTQSVTQGDMDFLIRSLDPQTRRAVAQQGLRALVDRYVLTLVLAQEAASNHLDDNVDFRRQLAAQRDRMLAQAEYQKLIQQTKVTPEEVSQYYAAHGSDFEEIRARQIVVRVKTQDAKEGTPGLTLEEGRTRIAEIRKALASGADPKQVAKDFGIANQVLVEAEPRTIRQSASLPGPQKQLFNLKNGEFGEVQEVGGTLALLQVVSRGRVELKDASQEIENTLRHQKLDAEIAELKKKSNVWIDEAYFKVASAPAPEATPTDPHSNPPAKP
jgi:hypothetical protein